MSTLSVAMYYLSCNQGTDESECMVSRCVPADVNMLYFCADTTLCTLLYALNIRFFLKFNHFMSTPTHSSRVCETVCVGGHRVIIL